LGPNDGRLKKDGPMDLPRTVGGRNLQGGEKRNHLSKKKKAQEKIYPWESKIQSGWGFVLSPSGQSPAELLVVVTIKSAHQRKETSKREKKDRELL